MDLIGEERGRLTRAAQWLSATRAELVGLAILLAGCVALTATLWLSSAHGPPPVTADGVGGIGPAVDPDDLAAATDDDGAWDDGAWDDGGSGAHEAEREASEPVVVHVSGAVAEPGLLSLEAGSRVGDAVEAAGGPVDDADVDRVNLAQVLTDGERVHVPRQGEELPADAATGTPGSEGSGAGGPIDLNRADVGQLETLPGIGPARARAIVEHRQAHGPFGEPGDLRAVSGIGEATFQRLADLITVS